MFEISIFCVILLAIGYWVALWLMGRHDDVLHGDFVQTEQEPEPAATSSQPTSSLPLHPGGAESLQSLLASIKRDLKDAAQI
jgi:Ca2+/H+ antiporter